jgi:hypothetical protein
MSLTEFCGRPFSVVQLSMTSCARHGELQPSSINTATVKSDAHETPDTVFLPRDGSARGLYCGSVDPVVPHGGFLR